MLTYIIIIVPVVLAIIIHTALESAPDFEEATGYDPRCFDCNESDCAGCVVTGPCYGCQKTCSADCPFDPVLGQYTPDGGYYFNNHGEIIGTYTKGERHHG